MQYSPSRVLSSAKRSTLRQALSLLVFGGLIACAPAVEPPTAKHAAAEFDAVLDGLWQLQVDDNPMYRLVRSLPVSDIPSLEFERVERQAERARDLLERLDAIDASALDHRQWIDLECARWDLADFIERPACYWHLAPVTPYQLSDQNLQWLFRSVSVKNAEEAERFLGLARQFAVFLEQLEGKLRGQVERGIVLPKAEIELVLPMWQAYVDDPSALFKPVLPEDGPPPQGFAARLDEISRELVRPAAASLVAFLDGPYRAAAPDAVGLAQYPGGTEHYRRQLRFYTTLSDLDPAEVHALGLEMVERNNARMDEIARQEGAADRKDYLRALRADPANFASDAEQLGAHLMDLVARIEPKIDDFFLHRPAAPYGVERLAPEREGAMSYGTYSPPTATHGTGRYLYNGSRLDERPLYAAATLIAHELIPGHHFQLGLHIEDESLPDFRRLGIYWGYGEGWGEYASVLAGEMGMYRTPAERYARLAAENFFAARLVVDTGMNALGWSREQAVDFMLEHTLESETLIRNETLRYATDRPAQALCYALGREKILELRERARAELGERFDLRRFHDAVLGWGPMPLAVLEKHIEWWIGEEKQGDFNKP